MRRTAARALLALAASAAACAGAAPEAPAPVPTRLVIAATASPDVPASPSASAPAPSAAANEQPPPAAAPSPLLSAPFPPPAFGAPFARTAKPGDGAWEPMDPGAPAGSPPALYRSTVHPEPIKPFVYVAVVAIDLTRVALTLVAGTDEPVAEQVPAERRPALVAPDDQASLIAVFNGGFKARHGGYGMRLGPDLFVPPRADACGVAIEPGGGVLVAPWSAIAEREAALAAWRQTPPCLLDRGELHPDLEAEARTRRWGSAEGGDLEVRRSALGLAEGGRTLLYGLGEWTTAKALATGMKAAGAVSAAELDINWSYTFFLLFGHPAPGDPLQVTSALVPKTKFTPRRFVEKPAARDFFYLSRRR